MRKNAKNNKKGFTLIELIVVVAILVALMLMLVPKLTGFTEDAKRTANEANARAIYTAIKASETAETTEMYPAADKTVKLCSATATVYKQFWEDGDIETSVCTYVDDSTGSYVKYGTDANTLGYFPVEFDPGK